MALAMPPPPSSSSSSSTQSFEIIETKIRRMLCPDLEIELLGVTALQWSGGLLDRYRHVGVIRNGVYHVFLC
jgi:hypothetical protein